MTQFPFPDRITARDELKRDITYERIPQADRIRIAQTAWDTGVKAAKDTLQAYDGEDIFQIAEKAGLKITYKQIDRVSAGLRFFSEYASKQDQITIYELSVEKFAEKNGLAHQEAVELVLAHEFFHYLEVKKLELTSEQYHIPRIRLFGRSFGKCSVLALSEIGAHGFARTYWETRYGKTWDAERGAYTPNAAAVISLEQGRKNAEKFYGFFAGSEKRRRL